MAAAAAGFDAQQADDPALNAALLLHVEAAPEPGQGQGADPFEGLDVAPEFTYSAQEQDVWVFAGDAGDAAANAEAALDCWRCHQNHEANERNVFLDRLDQFVEAHAENTHPLVWTTAAVNFYEHFIKLDEEEEAEGGADDADGVAAMDDAAGDGDADALGGAALRRADRQREPGTGLVFDRRMVYMHYTQHVVDQRMASLQTARTLNDLDLHYRRTSVKRDHSGRLMPPDLNHTRGHLMVLQTRMRVHTLLAQQNDKQRGGAK